MLNWALAFLVVAIICAVLGFGGVAPPAAAFIPKVFFVVFTVLFLTALLAGRAWRP